MVTCHNPWCQIYFRSQACSSQASHLCSKNSASTDRDYRDKSHIWILCTALIASLCLAHSQNRQSWAWEVVWKEQGSLAPSQPSVDVALLLLHPHELLCAAQCWAWWALPALAAAACTLHCTLLQIPASHRKSAAWTNALCRPDICI